MKRLAHFLVLSLACAPLTALPAADKPDHGDAHAGENSIVLSAEQRAIADIVVTEVIFQPIANTIVAQAETRLNRYTTRLVTPRIEAQVIARHTRLGDSVVQGQLLVTLSSVAMADAQGTFLIAEQEWQRVKKLSRKVVAESRYQEARIAAQTARARLLAYGMTIAQVDELIAGNRVDQANGEFRLLAPIAGTVTKDDFITGQMIRPGDLLFEIADESTLWVEARLDPSAAHAARIGDLAQLVLGQDRLNARVVQVHHALDEATRTLGIRLEIDNPNDRLHPGQFVTVRVQTGDSGTVGLVLPLAAVLRSADGDWVVFIEHEPNEFAPREVEIVRELGNTVVIDGIEPGTLVVTQGAFFIQSELAKSGFAVHNH